MTTMTQKYIDKNVRLSIEFDNYIARHPELFESIPNGATVVITLSDDDDFSKANISIVEKSRSRRPIVEARKSDGVWNITPLQLKAA
jgi:hypothetical protein